ncbi:PAS domain S-box protein [Anditalea andensis]|uniref:histidine kinase n=1 Tax=Anditalea andensis TaxID=1048983 RepID=A0A074LPE2_9BACT|nr:PAS domain S-box protein [Anditalea andensis]KEO75792.1 hypothetical protein EL17_22465 [Anditalea andensis]
MVSNRYLKEIFHISPLPMLIIKAVSTDYEMVNANPAFNKISDLTNEQLIGQKLFDVFHSHAVFNGSHGLHMLRSSLERVIATKKPDIMKRFSYDIHHHTYNQSLIKYWEPQNHPILDEDGNIEYILHMITEVTDADEFVKESERKIQKILDHSLDIICTVDATGKVREINAAVEVIWGYTRKEVEGRAFVDFVHEEDKPLTLQQTNNLIGAIEPLSFENRFIHKNAKSIPMLWSAHWDRNEERIFCVGKDATIFKKAEAHRKLNEEQFKSLVQHGADFIAILNITGISTYVSPSSKTITGWETDQLLGKNAFSFIHPEDVDRIIRLFNKIIDGEKTVIDTFRTKKKDGKYIWLETYAINMLNNPIINGVVINARDVTEKKHYLEWYEYVNKATNNAIFDWNLEEDLIQWGGNTALLFNAPSEIMKQKIKDFSERIHSDDRENTLKHLNEMISQTDVQHIETTCRIAHEKGHYLDININGFFVRNRSGAVIRMIGAIRDITEQRKYETALQLSNQRYELVTQATSDAIWDWDIGTNSVFWGGGIEKLFGYSSALSQDHIHSWHSRIHPKDFKKVTGQISQIITSNKNIWEGEYRFLKSDGEYNYVYDRGFVVRDESGKALRMVGAMQNIHQDKIREVEKSLKLGIGKIFTLRKTLNHCLKDSLKAIYKIHEYAFGEIWMTSLDRKSIALRAHYGINKYTVSEDHGWFEKDHGLPGKVWSQNVPFYIDAIEDDPDFIRKTFAKENNFGFISGFPIHSNKQVIAVIIFFYKTKENMSKGAPFTQEILDFLGSEIQRKKAELELDHFFELSPDLMCITDANGVYMKINEAFITLLGYHKDDIISTNFIELIHSEDRHIFTDMADKVASGEIMNHESRMKKKSGTYQWLSWTAKPFPGDGLIIAVGKDISEKKLQEEALANSHLEMLSILESIQDGFIAIDSDWTVSYWNTAAEKMINASRENILGKNIWSVLPEAKTPKLYTEFDKVIKEGVSSRFDEYFASLDMWLMVSAYPSKTGMTAYLKDITATKAAAVKLAQFKKVIESCQDEIAIISTINESVYLNPAFIESFGYGSEMLKHLGGPQKIFANESQAVEVFADLLAGRHWKGDVELKDNSKNIRSYYISSGPIYDDHNLLIAVFIIHTDISNRKDIESKLRTLYNSLKQQAKELTRYRKELDQFAHIASKDLKEPLEELNHNLHAFKTNYAQSIDGDGWQDIHKAMESTDRMQHLIGDLLDYTLAGKEEGHFSKVDLNEVIKETLLILKDDIHEKYAKIEVAKLPLIKGHKSHFFQIFKNLIGICLTNHPGKPEIEIHFSSDNTTWNFSCRDKGPKNNVDELNKIFQLFEVKGDKPYDSKEIGLSIIRKIVSFYKGRIWIESDSPGFVIHFTISKDLD